MDGAARRRLTQTKQPHRSAAGRRLRETPNTVFGITRPGSATFGHRADTCRRYSGYSTWLSSHDLRPMTQTAELEQILILSSQTITSVTVYLIYGTTYTMEVHFNHFGFLAPSIIVFIFKNLQYYERCRWVKLMKIKISRFFDNYWYRSIFCKQQNICLRLL